MKKQVTLKELCEEVRRAESWALKTNRSTWQWSNPCGESDWSMVIAKIPTKEREQDPPEFFKVCFEDWYDNNPDLTIDDVLDDIVDNHLF